MDFTGRHVVITGASSGIGKATAAKIAALGGRVTLIARRGEVLAAACAEIGPNARWIAADVSIQHDLRAALDSAIAQGGPIDGLFLNAATGGTFASLCDYPEESFEAVLALNLRSPWWALRHVLPAMLARGRGAIVLTGSLASERGMAGNAAYVVSKHALRGLAMALSIRRCGPIPPPTPTPPWPPARRRAASGALKSSPMSQPFCCRMRQPTSPRKAGRWTADCSARSHYKP